MSSSHELLEFARAAGEVVESAIVTDLFYTRLTDYIAFVGYTILIWDHVISFDDEVKFIWMRPKSLAVYIFFLNRYFTPVAFIGNLIAYFSQWSDKKCKDFVRYEGSCTIIALEVAAILLLFRVWALYKDSKWHPMIVGSVIFILAIETAVMAWMMTRSLPVPHPGNLDRACTMFFDPQMHGIPSLTAWLPLIYDTYVILLTLYKCMPRVQKSTAGHIFRTLLRDGLLYYSVIFVINFILAIMIVAAQNNIKNLAAQLEQMLTVAMMSRITISLRREASKKHTGLITADDSAYHLELDAWEVNYSQGLGSQHNRAKLSSVVCQRVSIVSASVCTTESALSANQDLADGSKHNSLRYSAGSSMQSSSMTKPGTCSIGTRITNPTLAHEVGLITSPERAVVFMEPVLWNELRANELRTIRPVHL